MDKVNLNFNGKDNVIKSICWICSVLSWLLYLITGFISFKWLEKYRTEWTNNYSGGDLLGILGVWADGHGRHNFPYPFQMEYECICTVFAVILCLSLAAFIIYMIKSTCKKDDLYDKMMGEWSKFHFVPLLCVSALFLITDTMDTKKWKGHDSNISGIIFDILGLASLIFIYINTELKPEWIEAPIKKGTYSALIALLWYYLLMFITNLILHDKHDKIYDTYKGCGIAFSIIYGVGILVFAFFMTDVFAPFIALIIYIGCTAYFFDVDKTIRKMYKNELADGIIDIIMMVLCVAMIVFLIITKKKDCLK